MNVTKLIAPIVGAAVAIAPISAATANTRTSVAAAAASYTGPSVVAGQTEVGSMREARAKGPGHYIVYGVAITVLASGIIILARDKRSRK